MTSPFQLEVFLEYLFHTSCDRTATCHAILPKHSVHLRYACIELFIGFYIFVFFLPHLCHDFNKCASEPRRERNRSFLCKKRERFCDSLPLIFCMFYWINATWVSFTASFHRFSFTLLFCIHGIMLIISLKTAKVKDDEPTCLEYVFE